MKSKKTLATAVIAAVLVIATVLAVLIVNPAHWEWPARFVPALLRPVSQADTQQDGQLWTCPMHPEVVRDHADTCPICEMNLVKKEEPASDATEAAPPH